MSVDAYRHAMGPITHLLLVIVMITLEMDLEIISIKGGGYTIINNTK